MEPGPGNSMLKALSLPLAWEPVEGEKVWESSPRHGLPVPRQEDIEDAAVTQPQTTPASRAARAGHTGTGAWSHIGQRHCWTENERNEGGTMFLGMGHSLEDNPRSHTWQLQCYHRKPQRCEIE